MLNTNVTAAKPQKGEVAQTAAARREQVLAGQLQMMDDMIKSQKAAKARADKPSSSASEARAPAAAPAAPAQAIGSNNAPHKVTRPATPQAEDTSEAERIALSLALVTRLLRGRAAQNRMFEGKERRAALIQELREADEAAPEPAVREQQDELHARATRGIAVLDGAMDTVQGEAVSSTLDMLSKELVRKEEQERITSAIDQAREERREREAEEGGRRQAEDAVRGREDQMYEQVVRVHQGTAESYVDELMAMQADAIAHEALSETSSRPSSAASNASRGGEESVGGEVKQLVASFFLPVVDRQRVRQQVQQEERRFVDAAHSTIDGATQS